ncbi:MAG: tetratricopeptide repeat protein [Candidatus Thorarchaeota archaeon]
MAEDPIIPEFMMYRPDLEESEIEEIASRFAVHTRSTEDRFLLFTDILIEYVGAGEWQNRSPAFLSMCAKACFLRGMYGYNQILAKDSHILNCKGYAAAAYCRQSLDPRWLNNLRNITNQAWQAKDYITFAELSGQLASILIDLGYTDHAQVVASESIDKVTLATAQDEDIRTMVQAALLRPRIILAYIAGNTETREEGLIRLDSAHDTAKLLDHQLALNDIRYYRGMAFEDTFEHDRAMPLASSALQQYERMGYLPGVANARNLTGVIHINLGQMQDARDQFEELLIIQQQLNNQIGLARTLINVGEIDRTLGQIDQMETYNQRALEISQEAEYMRGITVATINLGDVEIRKGDVKKALEFYEKALRLAEGAGMRQTSTLVHLVAGDAHFLLDDIDRSFHHYKRASEIAIEIGHSLYAFNAAVSTIVTHWVKETTPDNEQVDMLQQKIGETAQWLNATESSLMKEVRRKVLDDPASDNNLCIFFDNENCFECRVERNGLRKECFGNLFWMGNLCPHFRDFLAKLYG